MTNLENLRKQARQLVRWQQQHNYAVASRIRAALPQYHDLSDEQILTQRCVLADAAQLLLAREAGFDTWAMFKSGVAQRPQATAGSAVPHVTAISVTWQPRRVNITQAGPDDIEDLARLLWQDTHNEQPAQAAVDAFATELGRWCDSHHQTHTAFVARSDRPEVVGMAWVALVPRIPRPGATNRLSADIQTVFVMPQHRGQGIGSALVDAATQHALRLGAIRVTVHSGSKAVPVYERLGFESSRQLLQRHPS